MIRVLILFLALFVAPSAYAEEAVVESGHCGWAKMDGSDTIHQQCLKERYFGKIIEGAAAYSGSSSHSSSLGYRVYANSSGIPTSYKTYLIDNAWDLAEAMVEKRNAELPVVESATSE